MFFLLLKNVCQVLASASMVARIQTRKMNLFAKILNNFQLLSSLEKKSSKMFDRVLNASLENAHFVYIVLNQFLTVLWFKDFYWRFEWIPEFGKFGLLLNYIKRFCLILIISKNAWDLIFYLFFNFRGQNIKKVSFDTIKSIVFIISGKKMVMLLSTQHPLYCRAYMDNKKTKKI